MSVSIIDYFYFLRRTLGMREIHPKRFYEFKKNKAIYKSMLSLSNYKFQFKVFEDSNKVLLVYMSCYGVVHYESYCKSPHR